MMGAAFFVMVARIFGTYVGCAQGIYRRFDNVRQHFSATIGTIELIEKEVITMATICKADYYYGAVAFCVGQRGTHAGFV